MRLDVVLFLQPEFVAAFCKQMVEFETDIDD